MDKKGLTEVIKGIKKGSTKYKEILIDTKKVEITQWTTITEKWTIDEGKIREKAFQYWNTGFQNYSLLHITNQYRYYVQLAKYRREGNNMAVSDKFTFWKIMRSEHNKH